MGRRGETPVSDDTLSPACYHVGDPFDSRLLMTEYIRVDVTPWLAIGDEMMGTKPKCWLRTPEEGKWLFKRKSRPASDDDWSEKIAAELADLLGLPHAVVELATRNGERGIITRDLVGDQGAEELIPGNSLLVEADPGYPFQECYRFAQHTVKRIFTALRRQSVGCPAWPGLDSPIATACDLFTGYLLFDAWIGNTDRHHENWAISRRRDERGEQLILSPSYDHASSLGHNLRDKERHNRCTTNDRGYHIVAFAAKARSAIHRDEEEGKPVSTTEAFQIAAGECGTAGTYWLGRLSRLTDASATDIVNRIPSTIMSSQRRCLPLNYFV